MTTMQMYWLLKLDDFGIFLAVIGIISIAASLLVMYVRYLEEEEALRATKVWIIIGGVCLIVLAFLPNTKQMAAILIMPSIVNNEQVQELPQKVIDLGLLWIEELKPIQEEK